MGVEIFNYNPFYFLCFLIFQSTQKPKDFWIQLQFFFLDVHVYLKSHFVIKLAVLFLVSLFISSSDTLMEHFHEDDVVWDFTQNVENDSPKRENVRFVEMIKLVKKLKIICFRFLHVSYKNWSIKAGGWARNSSYWGKLKSVDMC